MLIYLREEGPSTEECVNEVDDQDQMPLDLALNLQQFDTARVLCEHGANVNKVDGRGKTFIAKAIEAGLFVL